MNAYRRPVFCPFLYNQTPVYLHSSNLLLEFAKMVRGLTVGFLGVGSGGAGRTWRRHEPNWTASAEMGFRPCVVSQLSVLIRVCLSGSKNAWCTREDYKHLSRPAGDCPSSSFMEQSVIFLAEY